MNLKIGEKVWSHKHGFGVVVDFRESAARPYLIYFNRDKKRGAVTQDGKSFRNDDKPDLIQCVNAQIIDGVDNES